MTNVKNRISAAAYIDCSHFFLLLLSSHELRTLCARALFVWFDILCASLTVTVKLWWQYHTESNIWKTRNKFIVVIVRFLLCIYIDWQSKHSIEKTKSFRIFGNYTGGKIDWTHCNNEPRTEITWCFLVVYFVLVDSFIHCVTAMTWSKSLRDSKICRIEIVWI